MVQPAATFETQAGRYDSRAGLPSGVCAAIAQAVVSEAGLRAGDLVVELGAGTGEIGLSLARLPIRYLGLDASRAMLDVFRTKGSDIDLLLAVADCDRAWPLRDGGANTIFASRSIHLLRPEHVARETRRVCQPGGSLILGRVVRESDGIAERLRRRRLALLRERGISTRQGEDGTRRVIDAIVASGGIAQGRQIVAEWPGVTTASTIIEGWESMPRMGSVPADPAIQQEIMVDLRRWATAEFGGLDQPQATASRFAIDVVGLPQQNAR
ncbi:MAG: class I SAM-dependent methyltransferase [Chloroflexota bacterium]